MGARLPMRWLRPPLAVAAGYAAAAAFAVAAPPLWPGARADAVLAATLLGFAVAPAVAVVVLAGLRLRAVLGTLAVTAALGWALGRWMLEGGA